MHPYFHPYPLEFLKITKNGTKKKKECRDC
jgi:hypothetical protein